MNTLKNRIGNLLEEREGISLLEQSKALGVSQLEILRNSPEVGKFPMEKIGELLEELHSWEKVFLLVITPAFVLEIQDRFPKGFYAHGFLNFHDKTTSIGGHLTVSEISEIFIVKDKMFGRDSHSIKFFGKTEKEIFAIYVPRDEKKEFIKSCSERFETLYLSNLNN